jgi:hypothetical protein
MSLCHLLPRAFSNHKFHLEKLSIPGHSWIQQKLSSASCRENSAVLSIPSLVPDVAPVLRNFVWWRSRPWWPCLKLLWTLVWCFISTRLIPPVILLPVAWDMDRWRCPFPGATRGLQATAYVAVISWDFYWDCGGSTGPLLPISGRGPRYSNRIRGGYRAMTFVIYFGATHVAQFIAQ